MMYAVVSAELTQSAVQLVMCFATVVGILLGGRA
jgi:hypothetical protein